MTIPGKPSFAAQSEGPIRYGSSVIVYGCGDGCRCGECHGIIRTEADHRGQGLKPFGDKVLVYFTGCGERVLDRSEVYDAPEQIRAGSQKRQRAR